jgi:hypothetical protein
VDEADQGKRFERPHRANSRYQQKDIRRTKAHREPLAMIRGILASIFKREMPPATWSNRTGLLPSIQPEEDTMNADENLALRVARTAAMTFDDVSAALDAMTALGYTFVSPGTPGRILESDDAQRGLAEYLRNETSLSFASAFEVLHALAKLGYRIREPDVHPSFLKTSEYAFTKVTGFGAAAAIKTIERSGYDGNGQKIPNR